MIKRAIASSATAAMLIGAFASNPVLAANPYLPLWEHLPDGEPRVFEDPDNPGKYRIYIIGSHDVKYDDYCGVDIRVWSAPVENLNDWRDEGPIFTFKEPDRDYWDIMFAPDMVEVLRRDEKGERTIKEYYLYPHSRGPGREAMVAKGNRPDGPFEPINIGSDGKTLLPGSIMGFDPSIYIEYIDDPNDPDYEIGFRAYGYWGFQRSFAAELDQNTMYTIKPGTQVINYFIPASSSYGNIHDPEGTEYPNVFPGENLEGFNFFEAASIRKVGNKFVWVYSGYSGPDYGIGSANATLRYAYGDTPLGPWKSGGVLIDARAVVINEDGSAFTTTYSGHNTHGSIELINDQWFVFYHRAPRGFGYARQPMVAPIDISWDDKPVANGGKVVIRGLDADNKPTVLRAGGHEYSGAEVTSEGFNINGLDPFRYYSAGIACYLNNHSQQADSWDIWDDHAPIKGVTINSIIGYKYFNFDIQNENIKNSAKFNLFLTPTTQREFKIGIWLDAPWNNSVWNGKKIGEIVVPDNTEMKPTQFSVDVSSYIKDLTGKHAIYLKVESGSGTLFNLLGLGFSAEGNVLSRPVPPTITITANDTPLNLPQTPVRATNTNGITDYSLYEIDPVLQPVIITSASKISAVADSDDVKINITTSQEGDLSITAIDFDYLGMVKTYKLTVAKDNTQNNAQPTPTISREPIAIEDDMFIANKEKNSKIPVIIGGLIGIIAIGAGIIFTKKKRN